MTLTAKTEAVAQITRAVRGLEIAIDKLEEAYRLATVSEKRKLLLLITELGERLDVPRLLGAADIGILASHQEGFSNSILEGMASGLPMIVTNVGGNCIVTENIKRDICAIFRDNYDC